jgi:hypothetical protein
MTDFTKKTFSVAVGSDEYRENFDRIFRKQRMPETMRASMVCVPDDEADEPGTMGHRFGLVLNELWNRFTTTVSEHSSELPETKYLEAIDGLFTLLDEAQAELNVDTQQRADLVEKIRKVLSHRA